MWVPKSCTTPKCHHPWFSPGRRIYLGELVLSFLHISVLSAFSFYNEHMLFLPWREYKAIFTWGIRKIKSTVGLPTLWPEGCGNRAAGWPGRRGSPCPAPSGAPAAGPPYKRGRLRSIISLTCFLTRGLPAHDLITSQRPHVLTLSHWESGFWGDTHIQSIACPIMNAIMKRKWTLMPESPCIFLFI